MQENKIKLPINANPYKHQIDAFNLACQNFGPSDGIEKSSGTALLMEMGTGKTITSVAIAGALFLANKIERVLIVAPLSIVGVWEEEFMKFADFDYSLKVLTGTGSKKVEALKSLNGDPFQIAIVNYESAWRLEKELLTWKPDLIVADEGHKLKLTIFRY